MTELLLHIIIFTVPYTLAIYFAYKAGVYHERYINDKNADPKYGRPIGIRGVDEDGKLIFEERAGRDLFIDFEEDGEFRVEQNEEEVRLEGV